MTEPVLSYARPIRARADAPAHNLLIGMGVVTLLIAMAGIGVTGIGTLALVEAVRMGFSGTMLVQGSLAVLIAGSVSAGVTWVGVDSIRGRRWVRPVALAVGWPTIVGSALVAALMLVVTAAGTWGPGNAWEGAAGEAAGLGIVAIVFGILVPGVYVGVYSSQSVARTLAALDPGPSWAERCPLSVFVAAGCLLGGGLITMTFALIGQAPVFGTYVSGDLGGAIVAGAGLALVAAAVGVYRGWRWGWRLAGLTVAGGFASAIVTMAALGMAEFYQRGGLGRGTSRVFESPVMTGGLPIVFTTVAMVIAVGFLCAARRRDGRR